MRIKEIKVYQVDLPFGETYHLSGGRSWEGLDTTIVSVETESGLVGWGESCPWGANYQLGYPEGSRSGLEVLAPRLIGVQAHEIGLVNHVMDTELIGHPYIKWGLDTACWDLLGKKTGFPVYELLGGCFNREFDMAAGIPSDSLEAMQAMLTGYREEGVRVLSIKLTGNPKIDVGTIRSILEDAGEDETYIVDVNKGYTVPEALSVLSQTADLDYVFEQPCATLEECAWLSSKTGKALSLDEGLEDIQTVFRAMALKAAEVMNVKVGRVGGITKSKRIIDVCHEAGFMVTVQEFGGSDIANAGMFHVAAATPSKIFHSSWDLRQVMTRTTADGVPEVKNGRGTAPTGPGLGIEPRMDVLGEPIAVYR